MNTKFNIPNSVIAALLFSLWAMPAAPASDYSKALEARRLSRENAQTRAPEIEEWRREQHDLNRQGKNCNLDLKTAPVTATSSRDRGRRVEQTVVVDGDIDMKCGR